MTICTACLAAECLSPPWRVGTHRDMRASTTAAPRAAAATTSPPLAPDRAEGRSSSEERAARLGIAIVFGTGHDFCATELKVAKATPFDCVRGNTGSAAPA
ncbi:hypothetical protein VTG60DRAFT_767 [Thermothelomyces hinnuleus]